MLLGSGKQEDELAAPVLGVAGFIGAQGNRARFTPGAGADAAGLDAFFGDGFAGRESAALTQSLVVFLGAPFIAVAVNQQVAIAMSFEVIGDGLNIDSNRRGVQRSCQKSKWMV